MKPIEVLLNAFSFFFFFFFFDLKKKENENVSGRWVGGGKCLSSLFFSHATTKANRKIGGKKRRSKRKHKS